MIVVEDGTGLVDAQSFVSVADAHAWLDPVDSAFAAATNAEVEAAVIQATRYICSRYGDLFRGIRLVDGQALCWPRDGAVYDDGRDIVGVPREVVEATCDLAARARSAGTLQQPIGTDAALISETNTVEGAVSVSKTWAAPREREDSYPEVVDRFRAILSVSPFASKLTRV